MLPTQPLPSYVLASSETKSEAPRTAPIQEPERHESPLTEEIDFDVDDFYDNPPCTD